MKLIDDRGRIFGKINLLDFIAIVLVLFLILLAVLKVFNAQLTDISLESENVTVRVQTSVVGDEGFFEAIEVGDVLGETKHYLDGTVTDVQILPVEVTNLDKDGNSIISIDPLKENAIVTFEATVPYANHIYKFGDQELRQGKTIFLESELYRYKVQIIDLKVVE